MIKTPDQRLRVFVSSTLQELLSEREAVKKAILDLRLIPVMFELVARAYPPRDLYTAYLQQSHIFLGIYWQQYGWVAPDMKVSGIEDEFLLSADMPRLIYIKEPSPQRAEGLRQMIGIVENSNVSYKIFADLQELQTLVQNDLAILLTERFELSMTSGKRLNADELNQQIPVPSTLLIGREREVKEIVEIINQGERLITLTGIGGIGKTRVALEVARQVKSKESLQVCFVPLDSVERAEDVPAAILRKAFPEAQSSESPVQLLVQLFSDKEILLVLDNFEQVIEGRMVVAEILKQCPQLKALVTSREVLHITGEVEYAMLPLELYQSVNVTRVPEFDELSSAIKLFVSTAKLFRRDFQLTLENYDAVVRICQALDGIPLAIELAAARMRLFSPVQLLPRLEKRFDLLKTHTHDMPARHQTLKATIDWSFNLLKPEEQRLLCLLSVFSGGCSLDAVAAMASGNPMVRNVWSCPRKTFYLTDAIKIGLATNADEAGTLTLLESLLAKSLAYTSVNKYGTLRINFYQTIIQYCRERLPEFGLEEEAYRRHLIYFLFLAENNWAHLRDGSAVEVFELFDNDIDNMTAALDWSVTHEPVVGLRIALVLAEYWDTRGKSDESVKWLGTLIGAVQKKKESDSHVIITNAQLELVRALFRLARYEEAWTLAKQCAEDARKNNEPYLLTDALCLQSLINIYAYRNENKDAILNEATALAQQLNYKMMLLDLKQHAASDRLNSGLLDEAIALAEESLQLAEELKTKRWQAIAHMIIGFAYTWSGNLENGEASFRRCLQCSSDVNDRMLPVYGLLGCVQVELASQHVYKALTLLGALQAITQRPGFGVMPMAAQILSALMEQVNVIPPEQRNAALSEGRKLHLDEAIQVALTPEVSAVAT